MVAVRMVSEGVDVPRLAVGVYATTTSTPLFFAQAVGRFVRARGRGETASVFLPSVPNLLGYAAELEVERDHVLGRRDHRRGRHLRRRGRPARPRPGRRGGLRRAARPAFEALGSQAHFDRVLFDGAEFGHEGEVHVGSEEEMDFLGIPGLLEPDQVRELLHQRQSDRARAPAAAPSPTSRRGHRRTSSSPCCAASSTASSPRGTTAPARPHGVTHAALRKECGGPAAAVASADQLRERIDRLRESATIGACAAMRSWFVVDSVASRHRDSVGGQSSPRLTLGDRLRSSGSTRWGTWVARAITVERAHDAAGRRAPGR